MVAQTITIPLFTAQECKEIIEDSTKWVEGTVVKFGNFITNKQFRSVQICNRGLREELEDKIFREIFK